MPITCFKNYFKEELEYQINIIKPLEMILKGGFDENRKTYFTSENIIIIKKINNYLNKLAEKIA